MAHGVKRMSQFEYKKYCQKVRRDMEELKREYPFTKKILIPSVNPEPIRLDVVAANIRLIRECNAEENDFKGEYSRELKIIIPYDYTVNGCKIYGAPWIDLGKIPQKDLHFNGKERDKFLFCLGVPQSYIRLKNVLLENVKTAENMLVAYESFQRGLTDRVELIAYAHGEEGKIEYEKRMSGIR